MDRQSKHQFVEQFREKLSQASLVVVTRQTGLNVAEMDELRSQVRHAEAYLKIPKNTLARLAIKGTPHAELEPLLQGPTALAYSQDSVAAAKAVCGFAKKNPKLEIVGGMLNGAVLKISDLKALAELPSLDELRSKLVGVLVAPASKLVQVLAAPGAQLARVLQAKVTKES